MSNRRPPHRASRRLGAPRRPPPALAAPPLLGALLRRGWQEARQAMAAGVRNAGFDDLQDAHLSVFQYPGPDGLRPSELARQLQASRQAANHLISQLEDLGYLERRPGGAGERRRVFLTARGRSLTRAIRASVRRFEAASARAAGPSRFAVFLDVLRVVAKPPGAAVAAPHRARRRANRR